MANVHDVAAYILSKFEGPITAMKLQKLCYYSQVWHMVWEDRLLFNERIEAWANGPVVRDLYRLHRGQFVVDKWTAGNPTALDDGEKESIDVVLDNYGDLTAQQLSELTHQEEPWLIAREGLDDGARSQKVISAGDMHAYYLGQLPA